MSKRFLPIVAVFVVVLGSINYYVGRFGWQWLRQMAPDLRGWVYWIPFALVASSFPLFSHFAGRWLPRPAAQLFKVVGAYWLSILQYAVPLLLIVDLIRLLAGLPLIGPITGAVILALLGVLIGYGVWNARRPVVVRYVVTIPKAAGRHKDLHMVLVSDTHFGAINDLPRVRAMVRMVNDLQPDLILLGGDLVDDDLHPFVALDMPGELKKLKAPLGSYAVMGNHDPAGAVDQFRRHLERAGIRLLVDEWAKVADSLIVIGRNDLSATWRGRQRKPLSELVSEVDTALPLVLIDHQPSHLREAEAAGIDLLVAGHTHRGQVFPYQYVTRRVFEVDWGYLKKGAMHVIVSLGFGTWGPPLRIGNRPEVVSIRATFRA